MDEGEKYIPTNEEMNEASSKMGLEQEKASYVRQNLDNPEMHLTLEDKELIKGGQVSLSHNHTQGIGGMEKIEGTIKGHHIVIIRSPNITEGEREGGHTDRYFGTFDGTPLLQRQAEDVFSKYLFIAMFQTRLENNQQLAEMAQENKYGPHKGKPFVMPSQLKEIL